VFIGTLACAPCVRRRPHAAMHSTAQLRILPVASVPSPKNLHTNCVSPFNKLPGAAPREVQEALSRFQSPFPSAEIASPHPLGRVVPPLVACQNGTGRAQSLLSCRNSGPFAASILTIFLFSLSFPRSTVISRVRYQEISIAAAKERNWQAERRPSGRSLHVPYLCYHTCWRCFLHS
jgi:hypothetical protein